MFGTRLFFLLLIFQIILIVLINKSQAAIALPKNLDSNDREQVVRILGWGTSGKILSDPYPLGGYSGLEVGLSVESVPVDDLGRLGDRTDPQENFTYPKITIGKGLYNNIDTWIHFIPFSESTGLSEYGGLLRWCFFQAKFFPGTFSVVIHGNSTNIQNAFTSQAYGADFVTGINISTIALYLGGGKIFSSGRFLGGQQGYTDSQRDETASAEGFHAIIGGSLRVQSIFAALQIDLYSQPVISSKLGLRF